MYQAMYRKYRPKTFNELVGQDVIKKTILNEIKNDKLSHAYLFTGPRGTGKTSVAKLIAKLINCENKDNYLPCDKCVSCTQINNGNNTDIIEIDAASNNGVDEIRELKSKINLVPSSSRYKVYIIDEIHMMTTNAFNALLKTIEEPPKHVIFILATTDPQKIPTTILSRCQRFDFKKITDEIILEKLNDIVKEEKIIIDKDVLIEIARISDGGLRDAIGLLDQLHSYVEEKIVIEDFNEIVGLVNKKDLELFLENLKTSNLEKTMEYLKYITKSSKDIVNIMSTIIDIMREQMLENYKKNNKKHLTMLKSANDYYNQMKSTNNPTLLFELFVIENLEAESINVERIKIVDKIETIIEKPEIQKTKEEEKINVTEEQNKEKTSSIDLDFEQIKTIRINNALANLEKRSISKISKEMEDLVDFSVKTKYKKVVSILMDGQIKAYGNNQIIYVFEEVYCANIFNENIAIIEEIVFEKTGNKHKVIAVTKQEWETIKKEFNDKTKKYSYVEENFNIQLFAKNTSKKEDTDSNKITRMFGDIVNYK
jgi:DNA polymerase III subunit gamma/tau